LQRLEELASEFRMGISELDKRGIVPARGKLLILGGAAGRGKTWGLIHIGVQALQSRKRVVHITCEIDEEEVVGRYYQSMFSIAKRPTDIEVTELDINGDGQLEGFKRKEYTPEFALSSGTAALELEMHIRELGKKAQNIWVKRFKPNEINGNSIRAYLDMLEMTEGFIPDLIIVDYLGIMKTDPKDKRGSIGTNCVDLRSIAIERNAAMVTAHQLSKKGEEAPMAKGTHFSEDWSIMGTADIALIYSVTDLEFAYGLGRIYVAKARSEQDRFAILITQAYKAGQFCLESLYLQRQYHELLGDLKAASDFYDAEDDGNGEDRDDARGSDDE
jgi:replicative DNA helicase